MVRSGEPRGEYTCDRSGVRVGVERGAADAMLKRKTAEGMRRDSDMLKLI